MTVLLLTVPAGCGTRGKDGDAETAGHGFVFTVNRAGWNEIWLMDEAGNNRKRLTKVGNPRTDASGSTSPRWSPDGTRIAFVSTGDARAEDEGAEELYVMDADGGNKTQLTSNDVPDWSPDWSPDGKRLAFARARNWGRAPPEVSLYVMDADGSHERLLHREPPGGGPFILSDPRWSPDGTKIAFTRVLFASEAPRPTLMVIGSDGKGATVVAEDAGNPAWSPDGSRIAFASINDRSGETCFHDCAPSSEIYVAGADGGERLRLTENEADDVSPAWSPDGKRIAFVSDRSNRNDHENEIYVVSSDGGDPVRITHNSVWDLEPDWRGAD